MADPRGFLKHSRENPIRRPVSVRIQDWKEVYEPFAPESLRDQAARCMDCGIPFCHNGCPLGNLIPEWNDQVRRGEWQVAFDRLHATNNFPEFTGRLCPAPCETACVLGISDDPVAIKQVELEIVEHGFAEGWVEPQLALEKTGRSVAVVGSGPAGLACAQQLTRAGHSVTVFERADRIGGLLRYGIPEFKMEKAVLDRRLDQMSAEGTQFRTGVNVGEDITVEQLNREHDAVVLAGGSTVGRSLPVEGADLPGVHLAMAYLEPANRVQAGDLDQVPPELDAADLDVIIIGGGDTGADCLGTAHRQGARSVTQLEIMPKPPEMRAESTPWPLWPLMFRTTSAHEEGGERLFAVSTKRLEADDQGRVARLVLEEVEAVDGSFVPVSDSERTVPAQLVLLAMGFTGPQREGLVESLGVQLDARGNVARDAAYRTSVDGVYVCGDMGRGQSLIVWAIAEGRSAAAVVDRSLSGDTLLPAPLVAAATR
ncbi:MAG: glutamate synthase subunit beta [Mycobacteriales bacterium]